MLPQIITTTVEIKQNGTVLYTVTGDQADAILLEVKGGAEIITILDTVTGSETVLNIAKCCYEFVVTRVITNGTAQTCTTDCFITGS